MRKDLEFVESIPYNEWRIIRLVTYGDPNVTAQTLRTQLTNHLTILRKSFTVIIKTEDNKVYVQKLRKQWRV